MRRAMAANLAGAVLLMALWGQGSPLAFAAGWVVVFPLVAALDRWIPGGTGTYWRRGLAFGAFVLRFLREFLRSSGRMVVVVMFRRREDLHPNCLTYDVSGLRWFEILLLSHCINLTPGSTTVQLVDDGKALLLHALDAADPDAVRHGIDEGLRGPLLRWTR